MARPVENTERVSTYITKEAYEQLKIKAMEKGMTPSGFIRMLIIESIGKPVENYRADTFFAELPDTKGVD